jgi:DNA-binding FadR family transcriptional regulator
MLGDSVNTILRLGTLDIAEVTGVRRIVEIPAARMAAENRTSGHLQQLRDIVEQQRTTTLDDPNIPLFDLAFHTTIADASGNRLLAAFVSALHSSTHPAHYLELSPEVGRRTVKQHIAIVAAIEAQNPAGAAEAMDAHLEYVLRYSTAHPKGLIG